MQKARAEPLLQCLHVLAGGGLGNAKFARGTGETPYCCDLDEDCHARQSIHVHHRAGSERPITIAHHVDHSADRWLKILKSAAPNMASITSVSPCLGSVCPVASSVI